MSANYWVIVGGTRGRGYFIRFESHHPKARWFTSRERHLANCFASVEDAQRAVEQFRKYGRGATIVTERRKPPAAPTAPSPPPPPEHLRAWIDRILEAGLASGKSTSSARMTAGYYILARQYHPDLGGSSADMQLLTDAITWLRKDVEDEIPF